MGERNTRKKKNGVNMLKRRTRRDRKEKKNGGKSEPDQNWSFTGQYWNIREADGSFNNFFQTHENSKSKCPPQLW